jgi:S1-C subfamily serine protease
MQEVIRAAEPAIACVLVSRSDGYRQFNAMPAADNPGRLGSFDGRLFANPHRALDPVRDDLIRRLDLSDPDHVPESYGSGVVIDDRAGLVLTNYHVVREATKVFVRLPGGKGSYADIHAGDPHSDLAVLKLLRPPAGLKALRPGRGEDARKGQIVLSLANPYAAGFRDGSPSASWGIVSNLRRRAGDRQPVVVEQYKPLHHYNTLIQTDARINLGSSGGALLNLKGELIGLTSALAALTGTDTPGGFAVPMTPGMRRIIGRLQEGKEVEYGFLGISFDQAAEAGGGVRIKSVTANSPAANAGLAQNTYIVKIDDTVIRDWQDLLLAISSSLAGSRIRIGVAVAPAGPVREEHVAELVKYHLPQKFIASSRPPAIGGIRVDYTSTLIRSGADMRGILDGVAVREVVPGSPAQRANIQVDRVITRVNGRLVANPAQYYKEAAEARGVLELTFSNDEKVKLNLR